MIKEGSAQAAEGFGGDGEDGFEGAGEMERVGETEVGGDVFDERAGLGELLGGGVHFESHQELVWRLVFLVRIKSQKWIFIGQKWTFPNPKDKLKLSAQIRWRYALKREP